MVYSGKKINKITNQHKTKKYHQKIYLLKYNKYLFQNNIHAIKYY